MKLTFLALIITISFIGQAQNYIPLPTKNSEWIMEIASIDGDGGPTEYYKSRDFISGDTIINDTLFIEITREVGDYIYEIGYLYQDTIEQKVYFTENFEQDLLLYDFNIEVNESFEFYTMSEYSKLIVESIDSIEVNSTYRKRINFEGHIPIFVGSFYDKLSFIEGIGSNAGLLPENYLGGIITSYLTCYKEESVMLYPIELNELGCDLNTMTLVNVDNFDLRDIKLFPNPFRNYISIDLSIAYKNHALLKVYDILGKEVYNKKLFETNNIYLSFLNKGIYLFKLEIDNRELITRTMIKL